MSTAALSPVSQGVFAKLNVPALKPALVTKVSDDNVPQGTAFPYAWFTLNEDNARGMGRGGLRRVDIHVHAASAATTNAPLQAIMSKIVELLEDKTLTVPGYRQGGEVFYGEIVGPFDSVIGGVAVREAIANFWTFVEPV
jgi:hypothetical protein